MTLLETERLILRNWGEEDRAFFHHINSDETIMEFFPYRRSREDADAAMDFIRDGIEQNGFGFAAVELKETGDLIGFVGLHRPRGLSNLPEDAIEIGWRLAPEFWGKGYVTEAARAWLAHGFETLGLDEIVSFAVAGNERSTAVMRRIGMRHDAADDFDHPAVPDTHPGLKRHVLYRLSRADWKARQA
ncbi:Acetyltransferase PA3944 [Nitratireductor aquimarinus]|uniref:GNAT family N-acetyltransferase n=1 Tax=Nitratireductor TaxID=245876 RepID=UPI00262D5108|nr:MULTISPECIES: GNAT family N-acetyltransferase [Nitratireductor]MCV0350589.1 GNAT family N-acetyltransferase [Nitratireductor sp.]MDV2964626.1 GNAT family N-acetyltransferase [Nitratireductor aquimarinus]